MSSLFDLVDGGYRLSIAQLRWVLSNMRAAAVQLVHVQSVAAIDHAASFTEDANRLEQAYEIDHARQADSRDAQNLDGEIDRFVAAIHGMLSAMALVGREHAIGRMSSDLLTVAFPNGLGAHVNATHTEQASLNLNLVSKLYSANHLVFITQHGIEPLADRLATLSADFAGVISATPTVSFDMVQAARRDAGEALLRAVMTVVSHFRPSVRGEVEMRDAILFPYRDMMTRVGAEKRAVFAAARRDKAARALEVDGAATHVDALRAISAPVHGVAMDVDAGESADVQTETNALANTPAEQGLVAK